MGFVDHVVQAVLNRTGPKEASQLLDLIQQSRIKPASKTAAASPKMCQELEENAQGSSDTRGK